MSDHDFEPLLYLLGKDIAYMGTKVQKDVQKCVNKLSTTHDKKKYCDSLADILKKYFEYTVQYARDLEAQILGYKKQDEYQEILEKLKTVRIYSEKLEKHPSNCSEVVTNYKETKENEPEPKDELDAVLSQCSLHIKESPQTSNGSSAETVFYNFKELNVDVNNPNLRDKVTEIEFNTQQVNEIFDTELRNSDEQFLVEDNVGNILEISSEDIDSCNEQDDLVVDNSNLADITSSNATTSTTESTTDHLVSTTNQNVHSKNKPVQLTAANVSSIHNDDLSNDVKDIEFNKRDRCPSREGSFSVDYTSDKETVVNSPNRTDSPVQDDITEDYLSDKTTIGDSSDNHLLSLEEDNLEEVDILHKNTTTQSPLNDVILAQPNIQNRSDNEAVYNTTENNFDEVGNADQVKRPNDDVDLDNINVDDAFDRSTVTGSPIQDVDRVITPIQHDVQMENAEGSFPEENLEIQHKEIENNLEVDQETVANSPVDVENIRTPSRTESDTDCDVVNSSSSSEYVNSDHDTVVEGSPRTESRNLVASLEDLNDDSNSTTIFAAVDRNPDLDKDNNEDIDKSLPENADNLKLPVDGDLHDASAESKVNNANDFRAGYEDDETQATADIETETVENASDNSDSNIDYDAPTQLISKSNNLEPVQVNSTNVKDDKITDNNILVDLAGNNSEDPRAQESLSNDHDEDYDCATQVTHDGEIQSDDKGNDQNIEGNETEELSQESMVFDWGPDYQPNHDEHPQQDNDSSTSRAILTELNSDKNHEEHPQQDNDSTASTLTLTESVGDKNHEDPENMLKENDGDTFSLNISEFDTASTYSGGIGDFSDSDDNNKDDSTESKPKKRLGHKQKKSLLHIIAEFFKQKQKQKIHSQKQNSAQLEEHNKSKKRKKIRRKKLSDTVKDSKEDENNKTTDGTSEYVKENTEALKNTENSKSNTDSYHIDESSCSSVEEISDNIARDAVDLRVTNAVENIKKSSKKTPISKEIIDETSSDEDEIKGENKFSNKDKAKNNEEKEFTTMDVSAAEHKEHQECEKNKSQDGLEKVRETDDHSIKKNLTEKISETAEPENQSSDPDLTQKVDLKSLRHLSGPEALCRKISEQKVQENVKPQDLDQAENEPTKDQEAEDLGFHPISEEITARLSDKPHLESQINDAEDSDATQCHEETRVVSPFKRNKVVKLPSSPSDSELSGTENKTRSQENDFESLVRPFKRKVVLKLPSSPSDNELSEVPHLSESQEGETESQVVSPFKRKVVLRLPSSPSDNELSEPVFESESQIVSPFKRQSVKRLHSSDESDSEPPKKSSEGFLGTIDSHTQSSGNFSQETQVVETVEDKSDVKRYLSSDAESDATQKLDVEEDETDAAVSKNKKRKRLDGSELNSYESDLGCAVLQDEDKREEDTVNELQLKDQDSIEPSQFKLDENAREDLIDMLDQHNNPWNENTEEFELNKEHHIEEEIEQSQFKLDESDRDNLLNMLSEKEQEETSGNENEEMQARHLRKEDSDELLNSSKEKSDKNDERNNDEAPVKSAGHEESSEEINETSESENEENEGQKSVFKLDENERSELLQMLSEHIRNFNNLDSESDSESGDESDQNTDSRKIKRKESTVMDEVDQEALLELMQEYEEAVEQGKDYDSVLFDVIREEAVESEPVKKGRRKNRTKDAWEAYQLLMKDEDDISDLSSDDTDIDIDDLDLNFSDEDKKKEKKGQFDNLKVQFGIDKELFVNVEQADIDGYEIPKLSRQRRDSMKVDRLCDLTSVLRKRKPDDKPRKPRKKRRKLSSGSEHSDHSVFSDLENASLSSLSSNSDSENEDRTSPVHVFSEDSQEALANALWDNIRNSSDSEIFSDDSLVEDSSADEERKKKTNKSKESDGANGKISKSKKSGKSDKDSSDSPDEDKDSDAESDDRAEKKSKNGDKEAKLDSSDEEDFVGARKARSAWRQDPLLHGCLTSDDSSDNSEGGPPKAKRSKRMKKKAKAGSQSNSDSDVTIVNSQDIRDSLKTPEPKELSSDSDDSDVEFVLEKMKTPIKQKSDDEASLFEESPGKKGKGRRNIRALVRDDELAEATQRANLEERERVKRLQERIKAKSSLTLSQSFGSQLSDDDTDPLILDLNEDVQIKVHPKITKKLKPHQRDGIQFMWDSSYESVDQLKDGWEGSGCILAHCMGLGKTLQALALIHTLFNYKVTKTQHVLVVCPLSTVANWRNEFNLAFKEIRNCRVQLHTIQDKKEADRRCTIVKKWRSKGGMLVLGYEAFAMMTNEQKLDKWEKSGVCKKGEIIEALLDPGPDLVICDEGHLLRNKQTQRNVALNKVKTRRRIILTGTPLQNNLLEYYYMVNFVKPNLLGTEKEFKTNFVNPITNGQYDDSTADDILLMKKRTHCLHKILAKTVQVIQLTSKQLQRSS